MAFANHGAQQRKPVKLSWVVRETDVYATQVRLNREWVQVSQKPSSCQHTPQRHAALDINCFYAQ
jgi:hypothetical protein